MEKYTERKKILLILSIISNVGILVFFKYFNFFADNLNFISEKLNWNYTLDLLAIVLPIGLSFHTFQAMSYTIEVYRGNQKAERHFGIYALYVMYYPQLVAGPIERPQNILSQLHEDHKFDLKQFNNGLLLMLWGFFKKLVIADRIAFYINPVFDHPHSYSGISIFVASCLFSFQIFCDFSGYSDIALGASQTMGIKLMKNFDRPYSSKTISEFWSKWHISLSTWFKDYVYIPLGGNRVSKLKWYRNIMIIFLISGFWHGANWTFIIWGALHGFYLIVGIESRSIRERIFNFLRITNTYLYPIIQRSTVFFLVTTAWVFFRSRSISDAFFMIEQSLKGIPEFVTSIITNPSVETFESLFLNLSIRTNYIEVIILVSSLLILELVHFKKNKFNWFEKIESYPVWCKWSIYTSLILFVMCFGMFHNESEFIYFQF
ncbi:MAG: MBOAT family O-acyltransferase [Sphingobacteriaceae bacterium]